MQKCLPARSNSVVDYFRLIFLILENVIGFALPEYGVVEGQGPVTIAVQLMQIGQPDVLGNLATPILARISTVDIGSASPSSNH